ncbi:hypothetical protein ACIBSW_10500 [Actinoplanes sp. NPDC049668]|uniref:hypothetical protein n=1 Tax=unclassified Actinoplanes TaxID=2626549 RepID=UPI0033BC7FC9
MTILITAPGLGRPGTRPRAAPLTMEFGRRLRDGIFSDGEMNSPNIIAISVGDERPGRRPLTRPGPPSRRADLRLNLVVIDSSTAFDEPHVTNEYGAVSAESVVAVTPFANDGGLPLTSSRCHLTTSADQGQHPPDSGVAKMIAVCQAE